MKGREIKYAMDSDDTMETATKITEMELMYGDGRMYEKMPRCQRKWFMATYLP